MERASNSLWPRLSEYAQLRINRIRKIAIKYRVEYHSKPADLLYPVRKSVFPNAGN